jgi:O-antigen ligase
LNTRAFLPLAPFAGFLFILPFPGTVALRLACLAGAFAFAVLSWRKLLPAPIPVKPALLLWIVVSVASLAYAVDSSYSVGEIKNEIGYAMMAFVAFFTITREAWILRLWSRIVVATAAGIGLWALAFHFGTGYWDHGGSHTGVGAYASLAAIAPAMLLLTCAAPGRWRVAGIAAALVILLAAIVSEQRIVWVAFGLQFVAAMWLLRKAGLLAISRHGALALIAAGLVITGAAVLGVHALKVRNSMPEIQVLSGDFRLQHWQRVLATIQEHPLTGAGFGRESMKRAYPDLVPKTEPQSLLWHPHNVLLTYGIGMGWPGVLALLGVFLSFSWEFRRHIARPGLDCRLAAIAGIMLVIGVVTRNMTNDFFLRDGALMFWALSGALMGFLSRRDAGTTGPA